MEDAASTTPLAVSRPHGPLASLRSRLTEALVSVRDAMGQQCSCLEHPLKYQRRQSDELDTLGMERGDDDEDQEELDLLVEGYAQERLARHNNCDIRSVSDSQRGVLKRTGSNAAAAAIGIAAERILGDEEEEKESAERQTLRSVNTGLMGTGWAHEQSPSPRPEDLSRLLRSYQEVTGVVDEGQLDLECIMCLDTFSEDNPKVRTLCNCGMNRTNFHLSCLLEWLNRDANCPVCRAYLFFEDADA
ncbi:hypothetical protein BBJ28_00014310 [Nothophytophthora sp. Chile5]|nr:hypothetical protein BBJ28_00014310 [Nothophytophthora sp. Chile5]